MEHVPHVDLTGVLLYQMPFLKEPGCCGIWTHALPYTNLMLYQAGQALNW